MNAYERYYLSQAGSGVSQVFTGSSHQKGHGVASFLKGIFRGIFPFLASAGKSVAGEAANAGVNILSDVASGTTPFSESVKRHVTAAGNQLANKLKRKGEQLGGSGYKKKRVAKKGQSSRTARRVKFKPVLTKADVFSARRR